MRSGGWFLTRGVLALGAIALAVAAVSLGFRGGEEPVPVAGPAQPTPPGPAVLYCEFYNFVGRAPKVGFTFGVGSGGAAPVFTQSSQIEADGTRATFETGTAPLWSYEAVENPAVLTSPDGAIRINLYGYDPARQGTTWFEAGLRSVQYLNLDGKCRQSGA